MEYATTLTCKVSVYHYSASVSEIEEAIGRTAFKSVNRGDPRPRADSPPFDRSSAHFEIVKQQEIEPARAIAECLEIIESSASTDILSNASIWIIVGLLDPNFVQVNLEDSLLKRIGGASVSLAIENRCPSQTD
jgi:hypothetical protein